jgi:hypothetical protein
MSSSDFDTFRFLTRERSERRIHDAQAERLGKEARGAPRASRRWRLYLPFAPGLARSAHRRAI